MTTATLWGELARLGDSVREHTERHPALHVASVDLFTTGRGRGRAEIYVSGPRPVACARLLAWWETLAQSSLCLREDPTQARALLFGKLWDGTIALVAAPLAEQDTAGIGGERTGEWVLHWLRMQALS
ncbi:hypothetical protein [Actinokineospora inagensis]|uniref:hypothetical protein n=1 Tax=Actinokineospora inagensis TaxID=103730 RepID=UPI0004100152|nr:hypothetical protein [Actinokineospora inagensis]